MVVRQVLFQQIYVVLREADFRQPVEFGGLVQQTHYDAFTVRRGDRAETHIDLAVAQANRGPAILGQAPFGDIHLAHDLDATDDRVLYPTGNRIHVVEDAVDAEAHLHAIRIGLEVHIRGTQLECLKQDRIDQFDDRRLVGYIEHILRLVDLGRHAANVGVFRDCVEGFVHSVRLVPVGPSDEAGDLKSWGDDRVHFLAQQRRQVVHGVGSQGLAGGHLEGSVLGSLQGYQVVVAGKVHGHVIHEAGGDFRALQALAEFKTQQLGIDLQQSDLVEVLTLQDAAVQGIPAACR